jgi:hypothetical protein
MECRRVAITFPSECSGSFCSLDIFQWCLNICLTHLLPPTRFPMASCSLRFLSLVIWHHLLGSPHLHVSMNYAWAKPFLRKKEIISSVESVSLKGRRWKIGRRRYLQMRYHSDFCFQQGWHLGNCMTVFQRPLTSEGKLLKIWMI